MAMQPDTESIISSHIVAGLLGSLVGLKWAPGGSWLERAANVGIGFGCAIYVTPGAAEWTGVTSPRALAALSFAAGMFGLSFAGAVSEGIKQTRFGDLLTSWLTRR
jgi:hypothetical protein